MINLIMVQAYLSELLIWIRGNYIEFTAAIISIIGVWLTTRQIIWCWSVSLLGLILSIYVFFNTQLYIQAILQIFYIVISVYGWYNWKKGEGEEKQLNISRLKLKSGLTYLVITTAVTLPVGYLFSKYTEDPLPWLDSLTTVCGIVSTYLMAKKILENWLIWVINDIILTGMCFYQKLYIFTFLYIVFIVLAIYGYLEWRKDLNRPKSAFEGLE